MSSVIVRYCYKCAGTSHADCWKDALNNQPAPYDDNGHGTHTMGTAVGAGGIGVAPGAKWIACKAFDSVGNGSQTAILSCFDFFLAPGGSSDNAPDVVNNSWGRNDGSSTVYQQAVTNWVNAGIYPVFSNGNSGSSCGTVGAPASYTNAIGIGATDSTDTIAAFSSRGPSPFGVIKPDLSAPGVSIRSAGNASDTDYFVASGTSMAPPHVTGLVALLLQTNHTPLSELTTNLKAGALGIDVSACGSSGVPNNVYGWGRIRAYESVKAAYSEGDRVWYGNANRTFTSAVSEVNGIYTPISGDFDGDGWSDVFWYAPGSTRDFIWYGNANRMFTSVESEVNGTYTPISGDFDGDGRDDVFWYAPGSGSDRIWYGKATRTFTTVVYEVNGVYRPVSGDFDGDGRADIFWYGPG